MNFAAAKSVDLLSVLLLLLVFLLLLLLLYCCQHRSFGSVKNYYRLFARTSERADQPTTIALAHRKCCQGNAQSCACVGILTNFNMDL